MEIKTIGVVGAGAMGSGIANVAALSGYNVVLRDVEERFIENGLKRIDDFMSKSIKRGKMTGEEKKEVLDRITTTTKMEDLKDVDFVIEAVIENMEVKKEVFKQLDEITREDIVLTTNTSSMSITEIAQVTSRPERVAGFHFFNPAQIMKLVEIVRGFKTNDETVETLKRVAEKLNKEYVIVNKDTPGFIVNRVMIPHFIEAIRLLEEGVASAEDIDKAVRYGLNYPMGPFELQDYAGVDIGYHVMEYLRQEFDDTRFSPPLMLKQMMKAGRVGRKAGAGFYDYE